MLPCFWTERRACYRLPRYLVFCFLSSQFSFFILTWIMDLFSFSYFISSYTPSSFDSLTLDCTITIPFLSCWVSVTRRQLTCNESWWIFSCPMLLRL
ncbi:hypothetical protein BDV59DRAFT_36513 [Aspergillus ambiguus]|uniref:uncharacterized protein n=1 Tax=Aspergillus ambiguus TaxID=176160 RepID=UPI003CCD31E7